MFFDRKALVMKKLTGRTILIVDTGADDRFLIVEAVKRVGLGLSAQSVAGEEEAIAYLHGDGIFAERLIFPYPSLVIIQLDMSAVHGFSVLLHLRQNPPSQFLPVLMLSNSDDPGHMRTAYRLGATSYCITPQNCAGILPILLRLSHPTAGFWNQSPFGNSENRNNHAQTNSLADPLVLQPRAFHRRMPSREDSDASPGYH
jgi:CheY-like chemotaxis protein